MSTKDTLNASPPLMLKIEEQCLAHELMPQLSKQYPVENNVRWDSNKQNISPLWWSKRQLLT